MIKKLALVMVVFLLFDRFIQHKIDIDSKQRLVALQKNESLLHKWHKRGERMLTHIS